MTRRDVEFEDLLKAAGMQFTWPDRQESEKACRPAYDVIFEKFAPRVRQIVERIRNTSTVVQ